MFVDFYTVMVDYMDTLLTARDFVWPAVALAAIGAAAYWAFLAYSDHILFYGLKAYRVFAGMRVKYAARKGGRGVWCYAEKGQPRHSHSQKRQPTLVFLHGFGADKDTWPSMIRHIPSSLHCVIIDLPGHGETTFVEGHDELTMDSYARSLREFLEVTGLDREPIHLIGCSFGGGVAGLFAHDYPECIAKLALLCPAIKSPTLTKTFTDLINGNSDLLIPTNGKQFVRMIRLLTNKPQPYPTAIMQSFVNLNFTKERQANLKKLLENLVVDEFNNFEKKFPKIKAISKETLIIWGEDDEMLHVSGGHMIKNNIKNAKLKVLKDCNHVIQLDQPWEATKAILEFLSST